MNQMTLRVRMTMVLCFVSLQSVMCTSVSKNEQKETLERILKVEEVPAPEQLDEPQPEKILKATPTAVAATPTAAPTAIPTAAPTATPTAVAATPSPTPALDLPYGIRSKPAPNLQQPARMDLPLPRGVAHADLFHFINIHADVIATYQPLLEEWKIYARVFALGSQASVDEVSGLKARVRENLARSHWLFVWGVFQSSATLLSQNQNLSLMVDRQQDFVERMNVLVFLMNEMQAAGMKTNHRGFLREFYKHVNNKHFKRPMRDRPNKPVGPLNPAQ